MSKKQIVITASVLVFLLVGGIVCFMLFNKHPQPQPEEPKQENTTEIPQESENPEIEDLDLKQEEVNIYEEKSDQTTKSEEMNSQGESENTQDIPTVSGTKNTSNDLKSELSKETSVVPLEIDESITDGFIAKNGKKLPADPREDKDFKRSWELEQTLIQYMVMSPYDVMSQSEHICYIPKTTTESGILEFMMPYLERSAQIATEKYLAEDGMHYEPSIRVYGKNEYPEGYPYSESTDLVEITFTALY